MYRTDFGLYGRMRGWDDLREQHWNMYIIKGETDHQPMLDARDKCSGLCTGKTQRDGVGRDAGGGIGMGNTCKSMMIHVNVWQKPLQYCKVISLQLIKINEKEKKIYSISNFQISNTVFLSMESPCCRGHSPWHIYFKTRILYLWPPSPIWATLTPPYFWQPPICSLYLWA